MIIQEMQSYYGKRAAEYDSSMGYDNPETVRTLQPVIDELRRVASGRNVLELACGPCFWTQQIACVARAIRATDFNETTLQQARRKDLPWDRVWLAQADAYELKSIPGDFDMVMAVDWFAHVPRSRIPGFLTGITQRVPKGSTLVFVDQLPGSHSLSGHYDDEGNHIQERCLGSGDRFRVVKHFFSDEELHAWLDPHTSSLAIGRFPECRRILVRGITGIP